MAQPDTFTTDQPLPVTRRSRALGGLAAARTLGALADGAMLPYLLLWASHETGLTGAAAGVLFVAQAAGEALGGLAGGVIADRLGTLRILLISTTGMALGYGALGLVHAPTAAVTLLLVAGLFEAAFHPTIAAQVADVVPPARLTRAYATLRAGAAAGRLAGPPLGALAFTVAPSAVFGVVAVLLGAAVVTLAVTLPHGMSASPADGVPKPERDAVPQSTQTARDAALPGRRLLLLVAASALLSITFTWLEADGLVLLRRATTLGVPAFGLLFTLAAAVDLVLQLPVARLVERLPLPVALAAGAAVQGTGLVLLAAASLGYPVLVVAVVLVALGQMTYSPAVQTFVARRVRPGRRTTAMAALSSAEDVATAFGPISGLALAGLPGLGAARGVWLVAGPACLAAGALAARGSARPHGQQGSVHT